MTLKGTVNIVLSPRVSAAFILQGNMIASLMNKAQQGYIFAAINMSIKRSYIFLS